MVYGDVHPSRSVFTIHNMEFGVDQIGRAVAAAAVSTTVSPTYAMEVLSPLLASPAALPRPDAARLCAQQCLGVQLFLRRLSYGFEPLTSALRGQRSTK